MTRIAIFICISLLFLVGCNKPDPNPELKDPIYDYYQKKLAAAKAEMTEADKKLYEAQLEMNKVKPQTGQIKYATKRIYAAKDKIEKIRQRYVYYQLKVDSQIQKSRDSYMKAFEEQKPWPDPEEYQSFLATERLIEAGSDWKPKARVEKYKQARSQASIQPNTPKKSKESEKE